VDERDARIAELEAELAAYRGLVAELRAQVEVVAELQARVEELTGEVERLGRQVGQHSGVSGRPPSSDTLAQRDAQNQERLSRSERRRVAREKAKKLSEGLPKRRPGKQPGSPGSSLRQVTDPDRVEMHPPACCGVCGVDLSDAEVVDVEVRQVFDLPSRRLEVTEHQAETRRCGCGHTTKAGFPADARAQACYGPRMRAVGVYAMAYQHLPVARCAQLLADLCGAPVSTGWLGGLSAEAAGGLDGFIAVVKDQLRAEAVLHADETGARVSGARYWCHVACTEMLTLLDCHPKRGVDAFNHVGVLNNYTGVLITDGWKPYWSLHQEGLDHALCCAHLLRDLAQVAQVARYKEWADAMADLLVEAKRAVDTALAGDTQLTKSQVKAFRGRYTRILNQGRASVPEHHQTGSYDRDAHNLLARFDRQRAEIQRHWTNPAVSFDNNAAEREVRMIKLQQKISGTWRTFAGAQAFCKIRSYIHTARKHHHDILDVLTRLFQGQPWIPEPAGTGTSP
jgi:transposase/uncharacterized coiled-coil protein SlyX